MGDELRTVREGEPFRPSADFHNATVETIRGFRAWLTGANPGRNLYNGLAVKLRNDTGSNRIQYDVVGISDTLVSATAARFKSQIRLVGTTPDADDHRGKFAILRHPIKAGKIGLAIVAGVTPAKINVLSTSHQYADVKDGDTACLETCAGGGARILYLAGSSGVVWGVVRIGNAAGDDVTRFFELKTNLLPGGSATAYLRTKSAVTGLLETDFSVQFLVKDDIGDRYGTGRDSAGSGGHGAYGKAQLKWGDWWVYDLQCP